MTSNGRIVVAIPCYNEQATISKVVSDFKRELPQAEIVVLDNRSTDRSSELARKAGAKVLYVSRQGKGAVARYIFREIDADIYVMVDGDDTYPAEFVHELIKPVKDGIADMVVGDRLSGGGYSNENKRRFHSFGNALVSFLVNHCFNSNINDIMTGYRAFSNRFSKVVPILSDGFEVETEITIRCLDRKLSIVELPVEYRDRPEGSVSKLRTFYDGFKVLKMIFIILKDYRPMLFFGSLSLATLVAGLICGIPVITEFFEKRYITHVPLAILATGLVLVSASFFSCAFILDTMISHENQRNEENIVRIRKTGD
ncbi:MAG: glycosyltransferase family 2 protein [Synergistaceae bacterium]|jgi:glycosyltransferase involved in cell wall biosynthesis|nr:glycosyltransferase family 2 protein [Synergistaceae bacterium]